MSILIIQLPARLRAGIEGASPESARPPSGQHEYAYVLSPDGLKVARHGRSVAAMLPRADVVVAVMGAMDLSWHHITLPKAPAARMRAALSGMLEEALLDEPEDLHLALAPRAKAGEKAWVAACDHRWLTAQLMALEKAKLRVDRVVPALPPDELATAFFHADGNEDPAASSDGGSEVMLTWSSAQGVSSWPITGTLAKALLPEPWPEQVRCLATPAVAAPAERWLGRSVEVFALNDQLLLASRSLWNLLQFDLTPRSKGFAAVADQWRRLLSPQWRAVRWGLVSLLAVQIVGLNVWAWHQNQQVRLKRAELVSILKQTYPQVRVVLDPMAQMRRETDALRVQSGRLSRDDMESLMSTLAASWPPGQPVTALEYDGSSLTLSVPAAVAPGLSGLRERLQGQGYVLDSLPDGRWSLRHLTPS